jgi:hypothetical protein
MDNSAAESGGGIFSYDSSISMTNCVIGGNSSQGQGGALLASSESNVAILHSSITGNSSDVGGAVALEETPATITNSISWGNSSGISLANSSALAVLCSDIENGPVGIIVGPGCSLDWGAGNIDADPLLSDDVHLACLSPCVDACGDAGVYTDIDGDSRPQNAAYDMGADEYARLALSAINLQSPPNDVVHIPPPTFCWVATGGCDNGFAVDIALSPGGPIYSTYEHLHQIIQGNCWTMPANIWNMIPRGRVYWRVRGADLDIAPPAIIASDEVWSMRK